MERQFTVLLAEDNPGDVFLIRRCFKKTNSKHNLIVAHDGEEAVNYLQNAINHQVGHILPDIILLDLNLPKMDGREVLAQIKNETILKNIPVIVFSSSSATADIQSSYELNANCYVVKPYDLDDFSSTIENVFTFWTETAALPHYDVF